MICGGDSRDKRLECQRVALAWKLAQLVESRARDLGSPARRNKQEVQTGSTGGYSPRSPGRERERR